MKIASFNANGIRARLPVILKWLKQESVDVLCVQETKVQDQDFPFKPFADEGYYCNFKGQKSYNGVAVISRHEPREVSTGFGDGDAREKPRLIRVNIDGVEIVNTYVPQGRDPDSEHFKYKINWFDRLRNYFETNYTTDMPVIWTGDFNVALDPIQSVKAGNGLGIYRYLPPAPANRKSVYLLGLSHPQCS